MSANYILDPYLPGSSLIHQLDSRIKVAWTLSYILALSLAPPRAWAMLILLASIAVVVAVFAEIPASKVLRRAALATPFALSALPLLFTVAGEPLWILPWGWTMTVEGLVRGASIIMKSWLSVTMAGILTATTPMPLLLGALRALGLPRVLVAIVSLMWRYLFVLVGEARRLLRARAARSAEALQTGARTGGKLTWRARVTGSMAGSLFVRALARADRTYSAMLARGYDGDVRTLSLTPMTVNQRWLLFWGMAGLAFLTLAGIFLWG